MELNSEVPLKPQTNSERFKEDIGQSIERTLIDIQKVGMYLFYSQNRQISIYEHQKNNMLESMKDHGTDYHMDKHAQEKALHRIRLRLQDLQKKFKLVSSHDN